MKRIRVVLFFVALSLLLLALALVLLAERRDEPETGPRLLSEKTIAEIEEIRISNQHDSYSVIQEDGGFSIADIPAELVNADYLLMLLDESGRVEYLEAVCRASDPGVALADYGLERPLATVLVRYASGENLTLLFGAAERVSGGQYFMTDADDTVYLMDHSRVVRFLQPLTRFINFEIVPSRSVPSPLSTIKTLTLRGRAFPRPVVITALRADDEVDMREALGFGATTHVIRSPYPRKIDQGEAIEVFGSLSGLLNIETLDYNCDDAALAEYGLDDPLVVAEYEYSADGVSPPERITLRAALHKGDYVLARDNERVVHRVEKEAFLATSYEKLVSRWFLTPFITDVSSIDIRAGDRDYRFELSGEDNRSLEASMNGAKLDIARFRKFYTLLVSASNDGRLLESTAGKTPGANGPAVLDVTFFYRDPLKAPDTMSFSPGSLRRLNVAVNGVTEFACVERYAQVTDTALRALGAGEDFRTDW